MWFNWSATITKDHAARGLAISDRDIVAAKMTGVALFRLGEREGGTAWLTEAVAAYRAALEESTRDRDPLRWAATQLLLGNALETLGERESGTVSLEAAVTAYHSALEELTRASAPLDWAATQNDLGIALFRLGEGGWDSEPRGGGCGVSHGVRSLH